MQKQSNLHSLESHRPRIGIDLLGSDTAPSLILNAFLSSYEGYAKEADITLFLRKEDLSIKIPESIHVVFATQAITMNDHPLSVLRKKSNSSIGLGMQMLKEGKIDALISPGNTGALLASAKTTLKTMKGIQRPALLALLPARNKSVAVLDVGASTKCRPLNFTQFAKLGIAFQMSQGIDKPKVGLLNIGSEAGKGTPEHQAAYETLSHLPSKHAEFIGNIEGRDVFEGPVDVLVTDGFTGNVFLKTTEGIGSFLLSEVATLFKESSSAGMQAPLLLENLKKRLDYSEYAGALLLGVNGLVLKCHGNFQIKSLDLTIKQALSLVRLKVLDKIFHHLQTL